MLDFLLFKGRDIWHLSVKNNQKTLSKIILDNVFWVVIACVTINNVYFSGGTIIVPVIQNKLVGV